MSDNNRGEGSSSARVVSDGPIAGGTNSNEAHKSAVVPEPEIPSDATAPSGETSATQSTQPVSDTSDEARARIEASSDERKRSLREAREAALKLSPSGTSSTTITAQPQTPYTTDIVYPQHQSYPQQPFSAPSIPNHPPTYPTYNSRSGLITGLKRLSYILSLVLGSSAIIGLFWSTFILPLLHSTFSARQVILEQQSSRFLSLVSGLRSLRSNPLFPRQTEKVEEGTEGYLTDDDKRISDVEHKSGIEEIPTSEESEASHPSRQGKPRTKAITSGEEDTPATQHPLPLNDLSTLSTSLRSLTTAISSTSTTRVSLLSTLETYTSQLHREVYLRSDPKSSFSVGLGSLSQNLASASGGSVSQGKTDGRTEWDDVRKEVRAIKGLLLGRRNFVPIPQQPSTAA